MNRRAASTIDSDGIGPALSTVERRDLQAVVDRWLADAVLLAQYGHQGEAAIIGAVLRDVRSAAEDYLRFISESEAQLRGAKLAFLRRNFPVWLEDGHARLVGGVREYRAIMLPRVTPNSIAREAGRRGERPGAMQKRK